MTKRHAALGIIIGSAMSAGACCSVRAANPGARFRESLRQPFRVASDPARACPVRRCGREFQPGLEREKGHGVTVGLVRPFRPMLPA
ncbi:MAG: hypothetical protein C0502_05745 [Opitutus sp.]|nr:hypothetical protein [Opitutus sp.]